MDVPSLVDTFYIPGTYQVCLLYFDSFNDCNGTYCDSIHVTGNLICHVPIGTSVERATCSTCADGAANAVAEGGIPPYSYLWTPSNQTTQYISNLLPGNYTVMVTDGNNCTSSTIIDAQVCTAVANFTWNQTANDQITFHGNYSSYQNWYYGDNNGENGNDQNPVHTYAEPGTYSVQYEAYDSIASCYGFYTANINVTGTVNCNLEIWEYTFTGASCSTCADGGGSITAMYGDMYYSYLWTPSNQTTQSVNNLLPGTYTVVVTDGDFCTASRIFNIPACTTLTAGFTYTQIENNVISLSATPTNLGQYGYGWLCYNHFSISEYGDYAISTYTFPGTYQVCLTVHDSFCSNTFCDSVHVSGITCDSLWVEMSANNASCNSCPDGYAIAYPVLGYPPYTYSWSPSGATTANVSNLVPANNNICCVTDAHGCIACAVATVGPDTANCYAYFSVLPDTNILHHYWLINYSTGVPPLQFFWNWGDSTLASFDSIPYPSHTYAHPGFHEISVTITDSTGCTSTYRSRYYLARMSNYMTYVNVVPPNFTTNVNNKVAENNITIYPNPANTILNIHSNSQPSTLNSQLIITDLLGNEIYNETLNGIDNTISISTLSQGLYFYEIRSDNDIARGKFVKE